MRWNALLKIFLVAGLVMVGAAARAQTAVRDILTPSGPPRAITFNPATGKLYIVEGQGGALLEVDERTRETNEFPLRATTQAGIVQVHVNPNLNRVYVSNSGNKYVTVFNKATAIQPVTFVTTKEGTPALTINRWTNKVYMTQPLSNAVAILDEQHFSLKYVTVGSHPSAIAVDEHTNKIYVTNESSNSVSVIDGATETVTTVAVGTSPHALVVDEVRNLIYVADLQSNDVTILDGMTLTKQTVVGVPSPYAMAINTVTNKIYAATQNSGVIAVINGASHAFELIIAGTFVANFSVDSVRNKIYTSDPNTNQIYIIDGETTAANAAPAAGSSVEQVLINPLSNMFYGTYAGSGYVTLFTGPPAPLPYSIYRLF